MNRPPSVSSDPPATRADNDRYVNSLTSVGAALGAGPCTGTRAAALTSVASAPTTNRTRCAGVCLISSPSAPRLLTEPGRSSRANVTAWHWTLSRPGP